MMKKLISLTSLILFTANAQSAVTSELKTKLEKFGLHNVELSQSPLSNLQTAISDEGIFYISNDGKYLIDGKIYALTPKGAENLTNKMLSQRSNGSEKYAISFPAPKPKYVVSVFIDVGCRYCTKLFENRKLYNDLGITLRFLPFPRKGLGSYEAKTLESIWASPNPVKALIDAEEKHQYPNKMQEPNIVKTQYNLGVAMGIRGTPALVLPNGQVINGYVPAKDLLQILQQTN